MASTHPLQILRTSGTAVEHSYIVKLKAGTNKETHLEYINTEVAAVEGASELTHHEWASDCFHGYAGKFSGASLDAILNHADVEYVEEDSVETVAAITTQTNAPWGLARISQDARIVGSASSLTFSYSFDSTAGNGVDIYVLDTGIYDQHNDFEGRATWGSTEIGTPGVDLHGHGTHCAGTAAGKQFGVAKAAKLIAVKVLGDDGAGTKATSISGMNWVKGQVAQTGRPSVVSMSTGGAYSQAQNDTIGTLTAAGIHVVVAAGNQNVDAGTRSPSSAPTAVTVGNSDINDARNNSSNWGASLDVFAPGTNVISCGTSSPNSAVIMSGTSMACPHVSGLTAYFIGKSGNMQPADMTKKIKDLSIKGILTNLPSGTVNALARKDI